MFEKKLELSKEAKELFQSNLSLLHNRSKSRFILQVIACTILVKDGINNFTEKKYIFPLILGHVDDINQVYKIDKNHILVHAQL